MELPISKSLIYSPLCSWSAMVPQVFFTSGVLCRGEMFKVAVRTPRTFERQRLQIFGAGGELLHEEEVRASFPASVWLGALSLDTSESLPAGSYLARVSATLPGRTSTERQLWGEGGELTLGEHEFHVLERDDYFSHWLELFGETWGEPVYWDSLESHQAEELLVGLPVGDLFDGLPEDFEVNASNLGELLGPVAVALAGNEGTGLPCFAEFSFSLETPRPPRLDLTKLFWLLNALAPALLNASLFSFRLRPHTQVYERQLVLNIEFDQPAHDEGHADSLEEIDKLAPLVTLVRELTDFAEIEFYPGKYLQLTVREERAERRGEPAVIGVRRA